MNDFLDISKQDFSFLGKGSSVKGIFKLQGDTRVCAEIEGEVHVCDNALLAIEKEGKIVGKVTCDNITIHGIFEGVLKAKGKVTIHSSAIVQGEINATDLVVHPGALLDMDAHTD